MLECADFPGHNWPISHLVDLAWFRGGGFPWHWSKEAILLPSPQWLFNWCSVLNVWLHLVQVRTWTPCCPSRCDSFSGETLGRGSGQSDLRASLLWVFPVCILSPCSVLNVCSHWSHLKDFSWREVSSSDGSLMVSLHFFLVNSSFLFRFLLKVEGLFLFFSTSLEGWFSLVTRETVREVPRVRLRVKCSDMQNVLCKPCAARVNFLGLGRFLVWTYAFFVANGVNSHRCKVT